MTILKTLTATVFAAGFASTTFAGGMTLETATGPVTVDGVPKSIAVLDVAAIDTLDALGVEIAGIPAPHFAGYLNHVAANATNVGSLFEPDFEALANLNPDIIVAGGRSSRQVEPLSEVAPTIDMTIWGDGHVEQVLARLDAFGTLTGTEAKAGELSEAFNAKLAQVSEAMAGKGNALVVLTNGPKVSAYGAGSRFGWIHVATGLPEAVEGVDAQTHGEAISFEFIGEANPDWLIVVDRAAAIGQDAVPASVTLDNALVAGTTAWEKGQVIYLNSANVYVAGGGYQSMMDAMDTLLAGFSGGAS